MSEDINTKNEELLEPIKAYNMLYKQQIVDEAEKFFNDLADKAETNVEENRITVKEIKALEAEIKSLEASRSKSRFLKGLLIFFVVIFLIATVVAIVGLALGYFDLSYGLPIAIISPLLGVGGILLIVLKINKKIKNLSQIIAKKKEKLEEKVNEAWSQMASLNSRYDWNMPATIIMRVIPLVKIDKYFDGSKEYALEQQYGLSDNDDANYSTVCVQSGSILGNPFIIQKAKCHQIINRLYEGSLVVTYRVTKYDSEGRSYTTTVTETLHASVTKPAPDYHYETNLIYGNTAAPDLIFSRQPQNMSGRDEKAIKKFVMGQTKDFIKEVERSTKKGGNLTSIGNYEFESLFHAWNRNNEVQFRLLFTPLAQRNLTYLLTHTDGYGDDFYFFKNKMINMIVSRHSQNIDYSADPKNYITYDYDRSKELFINYVATFFKGFYFDMVPLLSIPIYQQNKSLEFIYGEDGPTNYSTYEQEVMANMFDPRQFAEATSTTDVMLKTNLITKSGKTDRVAVTAYSYRGEPRTDYVPKMAGNGTVYQVPVDWIEYIPVQKTTPLEIKSVKSSRFDFMNKIKDNYLNKYVNDGYYTFRNSLFAFFAKDDYSKRDDDEIDSYFASSEENK